VVLVPIGAGWLVLSRFGATPLGFEEPIVLLTAVHFHYAAFSALVLVGLSGRYVRSDRTYRTIVAGTVAGTPLLAAGITFSPVLELAGALTLCLSLWTWSALCLKEIVPRASTPLARAMLTVSSLAVVPSMGLALLYAWGEWSGAPIVALSQVARVHGPLNALGFVLCGLLGFRAARAA
jgi:hypothetical protein